MMLNRIAYILFLIVLLLGTIFACNAILQPTSYSGSPGNEVEFSTGVPANILIDQKEVEVKVGSFSDFRVTTPGEDLEGKHLVGKIYYEYQRRPGGLWRVVEGENIYFEIDADDPFTVEVGPDSSKQTLVILGAISAYVIFAAVGYGVFFEF